LEVKAAGSSEALVNNLWDYTASKPRRPHSNTDDLWVQLVVEDRIQSSCLAISMLTIYSCHKFHYKNKGIRVNY
jgi:hypothetical protein